MYSFLDVCFRYDIEQEQKLANETTVLVENYTVSTHNCLPFIEKGTKTMSRGDKKNENRQERMQKVPETS